MKTLIADCETTGLLPDIERLWMIQLGDADTEEVAIYADQPGFPPIAEAVARLKSADRYVFHHGLGFDMDAINRFYPGTVELGKLFDTLVVSRICDPTERKHSLDDCGERLGVAKGKYKGDFQTFDDELVTYARQDIVVTRALYRMLLPKVEGMERLLEVEHRFARVMILQERNGFTLNIPACQELDAVLRGELAEIGQQLQNAFPPIEHTDTFIPKVNIKSRGYQKGVPVLKKRMEVFDPASRQHVGRRLQALGWRPRDFGKDGAPTVDETTLAPLPWPEAKLLVRHFTVQKQLGQLSDGKQGWLKLVKADGRVHGRVNPVGCAPGRCSHMSPNMAQVNKKDRRMRAVWIPRAEWKLVGIDGEGLQARVLSHYLHPYDGGKFGMAVHEGSKKDRSDVHSANLIELAKARVILVKPDADSETWDKGRDGAKRCLYACWFGARDAKLGWTAKDGAKNAGLVLPKVPDVELGRLARRALNRAITGFETLSEKIKATAKSRGYLISPLGRRVPIRSQHSALVFLMQAGECDVMKTAAVIFHYEVAPARGWVHGDDFAYTVHSHDEHQLESRPEIAEEVGQAYAQCITDAGVRLGLRCPLAGSYSVGDSWATTH